jgi:hypothetical protein
MMRYWVFLLILALSPAHAQQIRSPKDIAVHYPAGMKALQELIWTTPQLRSVRWLYHLEGIADKPILVKANGKWYFLGKVCDPAACAGNEMAYLIPKDEGEAYALVNLSWKLKPTRVGCNWVDSYVSCFMTRGDKPAGDQVIDLLRAKITSPRAE